MIYINECSEGLGKGLDGISMEGMFVEMNRVGVGF